MLLTDADVAALALPSGKKRIKKADGNCLHIWVEPGRKSWRLRTPTGSDVRLGEFPAMTVAAARRERDILLGMIDRGIDPVAHRRAAKKPAKVPKADAAPLFIGLADDFIEHQAGNSPRPATLEKYRYLRDQLKPLHRLPVTALTVKTLADVFGKIARKDDRRETAKRCAVFAAQVLERAASTTDIGEQPAYAARLAAKGLPKVQTENHAAIVDPERFGQMLRAIDSYSGKSDVIRDALRLLALLFPRPGELRQMRWSDVDLGKKCWIIPEEHAKSKRVHRVFLPQQAIAILKGMEWLRINDYVFPGVRTGRPMSENTLGAALAVLGFRDEQSAHGFRASAKTLMHKELSVPRDVVELTLGHRLGDMTEAAYMRDSDDMYMAAERAAAMQTYADFLDKLKAT